MLCKTSKKKYTHAICSAEIDKERTEHPELFNPMLQQTWYQNQMSSTNAGGMMNGQTPIETVRRELTGQNGVQQQQQ